MAIPRYKSTDTWPLLSAGYRPFFLAAGVWACVSMIVWVSTMRGALELPTAFTPVEWHTHEMLFGFVVATIAGFLLTAIPNWTGRLPLQGRSLGMLFLLWLLGRAAVAFSAWTGPVAAAVADLAFLVVFAAVVAREIHAGKNWRNMPVLLALAILSVANAMMHAEVFGYPGWADAGTRLAISTVILLIALIGGRIIPSFTANWLRREKAARLPIPFSRLDKAVLALSGLGLGLWTIIGLTEVTGIALVMAGAAHAIRMSRWCGLATKREPLLWILHVAYAWLPVGLILLGGSAWTADLTSAAMHALTAGAMGTMVLAVMTRASLGHSKRELTAGGGTRVVYGLVLFAAAARLCAPAFGSGYIVALELAVAAWVGAFALFSLLYLPLYNGR